MNYEQLQTWINENKSLRDICEVSGKSYSNIRHWLKKYGLKTNHRTPERRTYKREDVEKAISESNSYSDVLRNIGLTVNGGSFSWLKKLINRHNIDVSHFQENKRINKKVYKFTDDISNHDRASASKLQRFLKFHKVEEKCSNCGINEWRGEPIRLDIDHKDGNCINNKLENLQYLCPNCHRCKTIKYDGISTLRIGHEHVSKEKTKKCKCGSMICDTSTTCKKCATKTPRIVWPTPNELSDMINAKPITVVGRLLGVSDNAVRKHCIMHSIAIPSKKL
jgi:hypothetical protein